MKYDYVEQLRGAYFNRVPRGALHKALARATRHNPHALPVIDTMREVERCRIMVGAGKAGVECEKVEGVTRVYVLDLRGARIAIVAAKFTTALDHVKEPNR